MGSGSRWRELDALVRLQAPELSAPMPRRPWPRIADGACSVCRGPAGRCRLCYQCAQQEECAPGNLSDVVVPVAYAVKGSPHAARLWQYKSAADGSDAKAKLRALFLVFLRDHGACVWHAADMPGGPTHLAVVPTGRARPGYHPLRAMMAPHLRRPWAELSARPGIFPERDFDPGRFATRPVPGARVLLIDDTWTSGASAQSAALALRSAGAARVATIVLGRHVGGTNGEAAAFGPGVRPFQLDCCAVHEP